MTPYLPDSSLRQIIDGIKENIRILKRNLLRILLVSLVFAAIGFFYAIQQKAKYTAVLTFVAESENKATSGYSAIAEQLHLNSVGGTSAFEGDNLIEMLKSRELVQKTLLTIDPDEKNKKLILQEYLINHEIENSLSKNNEYKKIDFLSPIPDRFRDSLLGIIYTQIVLKQLVIDKTDDKLDFVTVTMVDENEGFAKLFVEKLTQNAIEYYVQYKNKKSTQNFQILKANADSLRNHLFGNINDIANSIDLNVNPIKQVPRTEIQQKQIDLQITNGLYTEVLKNLEIAKINMVKETPLIKIIDRPILPLPKKKIGKYFAAIIFFILGFILSVITVLTMQWIEYIKKMI